MGWIWRKGISVGKKVLAAGFVMASAPFLVPPLVVASTIALISSLPYCLFLASYVCTEKLMRKLLPGSAFGGRGDKMVLLRDKIGHGDVYDDDGIAQVAMSEPIVIQFEEDDRTSLRLANIVFDVYQRPEDMKKESKSLIESIRDDDRTNERISEKVFGGEDKESIDPSGDVKLVNVVAGKKQVSGTRPKGELESTTTKASREKDMETSLNEMKVLFSEEQIWAKMEALRKIVGYSVARSTTYSEELKALYMFTGVELPTSMVEENQDVSQVSERLCFLMSVIGVE
ncbi:hypothetical protein EUTSA_v10005424mg [Eutrema salsugineum]|uniref:Uncharacterized protein n=2 Tax=Eutrema salsugineum TaxID=72664 RepID=V4KT53_EUTSA|nr:uncharacterized protein LOC18011891 isoform X2 [Eutrema salsugineum]XP_024006716.1 uncharacterized protein LOC18011891 isoform X2 [Eutrema salsugineum]ESQ33207.1 hypothetical protein EUTSA_v10005424mg [Eutrema salsugineum]